MDLVKGRGEYVFDTRHKEALLRFIDNEYIKQSLKLNKKDDEKTNYLNDGLVSKILYQNFRERRKNSEEEIKKKAFSHLYKSNFDRVNSASGMYGKSFEDLVKEEIYGKPRK